MVTHQVLSSQLQQRCMLLPGCQEPRALQGELSSALELLLHITAQMSIASWVCTHIIFLRRVIGYAVGFVLLLCVCVCVFLCVMEDDTNAFIID